MKLTDDERGCVEDVRNGVENWPVPHIRFRAKSLVRIIDRLTSLGDGEPPEVASEQLGEFLQDQYYHHTNNFHELAEAVCRAFSGGRIKALSHKPAAGEVQRVTVVQCDPLKTMDGSSYDVTATITASPPPPQSDEIATAFIESPMPTDDQCRVFTAITAYVGEHVPIDKHDAYTPKYVNGLTDAILAALTRSRQDGLPTREKLAQCMYDGGIYGVCFWKELSHDHGDRADFLARADAILALIHSGRE